MTQLPCLYIEEKDLRFLTRDCGETLILLGGLEQVASLSFDMGYHCTIDVQAARPENGERARLLVRLTPDGTPAFTLSLSAQVVMHLSQAKILLLTAAPRPAPDDVFDDAALAVMEAHGVLGIELDHPNVSSQLVPACIHVLAATVAQRLGLPTGPVS